VNRPVGVINRREIEIARTIKRGESQYAPSRYEPGFWEICQILAGVS